MKNIIKRTKLPLDNHVIREGKIAYAIFTGYSEYYQAMIAGSINGRVVRIFRDDIEKYTDDAILEIARSIGHSFNSNKNTKVIRKGCPVQ